MGQEFMKSSLKVKKVNEVMQRQLSNLEKTIKNDQWNDE